MNKNLAESKSLLAKLLARENITVCHADVKTASFDTLNRVLTVPVWKDMDGSLYDLIMGHETGHALYTPSDDWIAFSKKYGKNRTSILNVVEDARIEKKIKRLYPGIRKPFSEGYKELLRRDFFGINKLGRDTSSLNLIDRLNMYFKCGSELNIRFTKEEKPFVKMTEDCESFDDVCKVTNKLAEYIKENEQEKINSLEDLLKSIEENRASKSESGEENGEESGNDGNEENDSVDDDDSTGGESDDSDADGSADNESEHAGNDDSDDDDSDSAKGSSSQGKEESEKDQESDSAVVSSKGTNTGSENKNQDFDPKSITEEAQRKAEDSLIDKNSKPWVLLDIPDCDLKKTIVPVKTLLDAYEAGASVKIKDKTYESVASETFKKFYENNIRYINQLVKEFEMRKNASQYLRQLESKSGELDMRKLASYKFSNDMFLRVVETPKGKSHGMIMFVDMSSSMASVIKNTMEQATVLALFCKKIGIPFHIYGFSDSRVSYGYIDYNCKKFVEKSPLTMDLGHRYFHLKELTSSDLGYVDFKRSLSMMITFGTYYYGGYCLGSCGQMALSGTPLMETIVASRKIIDQFKNKTHVDIVNVIYLTDGEGGMSFNLPQKYIGMNIWDKRTCHIGFVDPVTKIRVMVDENEDGNRYQSALTKLIRECTGCRHIGFYIGSDMILKSRITAISNNNEEIKTKLEGSYRANGFFSHPVLGYDTYYYVHSNSESLQSEKMREKKYHSVEDIKFEALRVANQNKNNRVLATNFAKEIA